MLEKIFHFIFAVIRNTAQHDLKETYYWTFYKILLFSNYLTTFAFPFYHACLYTEAKKRTKTKQISATIICYSSINDTAPNFFLQSRR